MYQNFTKEFIQGCYNHKYVVEKVRLNTSVDHLNRMTLEVAVVGTTSEIPGSIPESLIPFFDNHREGNGCIIHTYKGLYKALNIQLQKTYDENYDDRADVALEKMLEGRLE